MAKKPIGRELVRENTRSKKKMASYALAALLMTSVLTLAFDVADVEDVSADSLDLDDVIVEVSDSTAAMSIFCNDVDRDGDTEIVTGDVQYLRIWQWDGSTLTLEKSTSTAVDSVFCSDVDGDGDVEIVGGGVGLRIWQWDGATLTLEEENSASVGKVFCCDIDSDGDVEIVTGGTGALRIWQWDGLTLTLELEEVGPDSNSVFCGDVDSDGDVEIVTGESSAGLYKLLRIRHWDGSTLTLEVEKELSGSDWFSEIYSIFGFDVDDDGNVEMVTGGYRRFEYMSVPFPKYWYDCELLIWSWDGVALVTEAQTLWGRSDSSDTSLYSVFYGDIDGDGQIEIVAGGETYSQGQFTSWSMSDSGLVLENHEPQAGLGYVVDSVFCEDVDNDGQTEIVTGGGGIEGGHGLTVLSVFLPSLLPVSLEASQDLPVEGLSDIEWFESVACCDVDSDGQTEIVTGGYSYYSVTGHYFGIMRIWNWSGSSLTSEVYDFLSASGPGDTSINSVFAADIDEDGDVEIVAAGGRLVIWRWDGTVLTPEKETGANSNSVFCEDVDADGDIEIVMVGDGGLSIQRWDNVSLSVEKFDSLMGADSVFCGDVDNDGDVEIVSVRTGPYISGTEARLFISRWDGATLTPEASESWSDVFYGTEVDSVVAGDVDGDGDVEIVTVGRMRDSVLGEKREKGELRIWHWDGTTLTLEDSMVWSTAVDWRSTEAYAVFCGDVDVDGDMEIITGGRADENGQLRVWRYDGASITHEAERKWLMGRLDPYAGTGVQSVFCCDVDGDGDVEMLTGGTWQHYEEIELGIGVITYRAELRIWSFTSVHLVVRGLDDRIYYRVFHSTSDSWQDWNVVASGATCDSPAAAVQSGKLYLVVRGMDSSSLWFGWINLVDDSFSGWTLLSGETLSAPTLVTNGTALCLVVRGKDDRIYFRSYSDSWSDWHAIPTGATCDAPAAALLGEQLQIAVRGMDGISLWHTEVNCDGTGFTGWTSISGSTLCTPALAASQYLNRLCLIVTGMGNEIYCRECNAGYWRSWNLLPGATCDGPGATMLSDLPNIVVRGFDGYTLWHWNGSGWTWISGATASKPTLASLP